MKAGHIVHVVGTRPQFPKVAPVYRALTGYFRQTVIHTGQHYDDNMTKQIVEDTGCHIDIDMTGADREKAKNDLTQFLLEKIPDLVMVYGDCNVSLDGAQCALNVRIKLAHVEAGLRCGDMRMVEENNRIRVDRIADILYVPSVDAVYNLAREGHSFDRIRFVGNVMADSYYWHMANGYSETGRRGFGLVTMHRPENVDDPQFMNAFMLELAALNYRIIFPKHPRVKLQWIPVNVEVTGPMRYREFNAHLRACTFLITDSGGLQEEATLVGKPCLTMRSSTERPITITEGTNELTTLRTLGSQVNVIRTGNWKRGSVPVYWDGKAAERIAWHLKSIPW